MLAFEYVNPVKVVFGAGSVEQIGQEVVKYNPSTVMLVSYKDPVFFKPIIEKIHDSLAKENIKCVDYFEVSANPTMSQARKGTELCKECGAGLLIALGGGSVMDCTKVISAGVFYPYDISKMFMFSHSNVTSVQPTEALPTIMIPTIPATGSEMNPTAVVTDDDTGIKSYVWEPSCLYAKVAILDPELTVTLPAYQSFCGAIDIISHVTEAYLNGAPTSQDKYDLPNNLDVQDGMHEGVIKAVIKNMAAIKKDPGDIQARGALLWASTVGLNGWLTCGTHGFTPMHQMGHVLSAKYGATHGATLGCMLRAWLEFFANEEGNERYAQFAENIFNVKLEDAADEVEKLLKEYGVQSRISEFGAKAEDIKELTQQVVKVSFGPEGYLNCYPRLNGEQIEKIYNLSL